MITLDEARNNAKFYNEHLAFVNTEIKYASDNGNYFVFISEEAIITEVIVKLEELRFVVQRIAGATLMDKAKFKISW